MRIGFIGLGVMGRPMAKNLLKAGHAVVGHRRGGAGDADLEAAGAVMASTLAEAVVGCDAVVTMLPDSPDVEAVVLGEDGVFAAASSGLLIDMSTIAPQTSVRLAEVGAGRGWRVLDAPVSGGEKGAVDGDLSIMVGGSEEDLASAKPILEALGTTIRLVGGPGAGQTVKAANQLVVAVNIQALAEAVVFLEAHGVDAAVALDALGGGLAGSTVLARRGGSLLGRDFKPGFRTDLHWKDLGIVTSAARAAGVPLPLGSAVAQLVAELRALGGGGLDHTGLLALQELASGRGPRGVALAWAGTD
ncbi:MAG: 2-hydroxy-3-oxopropionate reductase [Propionibacteriaceae bacterium]|jgi:2-hydroxy-3-oxopropionate reductase|nr:2-hydroxy-3-oxopropionate reductase [Propionibacteriaceae bacterium]